MGGEGESCQAQVHGECSAPNCCGALGSLACTCTRSLDRRRLNTCVCHMRSFEPSHTSKRPLKSTCTWRPLAPRRLDRACSGCSHHRGPPQAQLDPPTNHGNRKACARTWPLAPRRLYCARSRCSHCTGPPQPQLDPPMNHSICKARARTLPLAPRHLNRARRGRGHGRGHCRGLPQRVCRVLRLLCHRAQRLLQLLVRLRVEEHAQKTEGRAWWHRGRCAGVWRAGWHEVQGGSR